VSGFDPKRIRKLMMSELERWETRFAAPRYLFGEADDVIE